MSMVHAMISDSARYLHATTIIDSKLYMHGGSTNSRELWSFNIDNRMWTLINVCRHLSLYNIPNSSG